MSQVKYSVLYICMFCNELHCHCDFLYLGLVCIIGLVPTHTDTETEREDKLV